MTRLDLIILGGLVFGGLASAFLTLVCAPPAVIVGGLFLGWILGTVLLFALENLLHSFRGPR